MTMDSRSARHRRSARRSRSGSIVLELLMALPVMVMTMDLVVRLTFDAAFMTGLSLAALEAAREGSQVFATSAPFSDAHRTSRSGSLERDLIAERIANVVNMRLRMLRLRVQSRDDLHGSPGPAGVRLIVRRGEETADLGDRGIPVRELSTTRFDDEIEVIIAVRMAALDSGSAQQAGASPSTRSWLFPDVVQSSARMPLE